MGQNRRVGFIALFTTIFCFGTLWTTAKISVDYLPPLWFTAGRFAIGGVFVAIILHLQGRLRLPDKADVPIILSVGGIMLGLYSSIFQNALVFVHAGRATVLGYTTAIFVTPVAVLFLGERLSLQKLLGLLAAIFGFLALFSPTEMDWSDRDVLAGNGLLVLCVLLWSAVILHLRVHRQVSDTLSLVPWYLMVSFTVATVSALIFEGPPNFEVSGTGWVLYLYAGIVCSGVGNWGVTTAILNLPATTSTVGLLGVPVFAMILSVLFLGEALTLSLGIGMILIIGGIAAVTLAREQA
ncbi:MAG: DMT family transporter [Pseudomonadota bacterium]|nr:DMT family transporter [Pseudomonadota bacterium]|tara:strand:+ start:172 stop:1059 length:888 start_codon:yes stop_codon:yes gene_type:complete